VNGLVSASVVIEGACRHLVRDRMSVPGQWSLAGAEAVLRLRALRTNGDIDAYWAFDLERGAERTHHARAHATLVNACRSQLPHRNRRCGVK
jgi:hypothetical protein